MVRTVRRIIAAHNENGESYIQEDGGAPNVTNTGGIEGYLWTELWAVDGTPASNAGNADAADRPISLQPPVRGNVFRIVDIPPDTLRFGANLDQLGGPALTGWLAFSLILSIFHLHLELP